MSNIKDLYVIDIKIIDGEIELLEKWKQDNRQSSEAWVCDNMIDGLENLKKSLKPLEPIVSDAFDKGYASDSHAEDKEQFLNSIKL